LSQAVQAFQAGRLPEAAELCQRALQADPRQPRAWHLLGVVAHLSGHSRKAAELIRQAIALDQDFAVAHNDLGNLLMAEGRLREAASCYRRAVQSSPGLAEAHNNLGNACQMEGALEEAVAGYRQAIALRPDYPEAHRNLASALRRSGRPRESLAALETAVALAPEFTEALALLAHEKRDACAWDGLDRLTARLVEAVESGSAAVNPFIFLCLETSQAQQFRCATNWSKHHLPVPPASPKPAPRPRGERLTLGYLSADFQDHATAHLISEVMELHDRSRFRVIGYSYGPDDGSAARRRLAGAFDRFVDLEAASFAESAGRIREDRVDILVDLKGYTSGARPQILALRPAPVQVNYMGYPGTMGTSAVDFILVDSSVVPPDRQPFFSEKLVHLPDCYLATDRTRPIAPRVPSRAECGLPEPGFVFCCFNSLHKITPAIFDIWMRLLGAVEGSVLWLLESNPLAPGNLRREAEARGIGAGRLVFAPAVPNPDHLARFAVADLFLDTLPYNAHTVAVDALWGGCPLVSCAGDAFPARVAASVLRAAGLPELVTGSPAEYEALALRLGRHPEHCRSVRGRLRESRPACALFDTPRFTRHLEAAYDAMWRR